MSRNAICLITLIAVKGQTDVGPNLNLNIKRSIIFWTHLQRLQFRAPTVQDRTDTLLMHKQTFATNSSIASTANRMQLLAQQDLCSMPRLVFARGPTKLTRLVVHQKVIERYFIENSTLINFASLELFNFACQKVNESIAATHPRYADPEDCQYFYVCIDGVIPRRNGCKLGHVFDERTKICDWPRNVPAWWVDFSWILIKK